MLISVNIELPRSIHLNMQHGSQWQCIQVGGHRLWSQRHHEVEPNVISICLSGYGGIHPQVK